MKTLLLALALLLAGCGPDPVAPGDLNCDAVVYLGQDGQVPDSVKLTDCREAGR